jgi:hypothetical protein
LFDVASIPIHKAFSGADGVSYLFQAVRHMRAYILLNNVVSLLIRLRRVKKYNLEYYEGFIVWITRNDVLNMIYGQRTYFVELRRGWSKGMKLIFMKKTHDIDYCFIGSGIIDRVIDPKEFSSLEKILCASSNCYRKIIFGRLARFCPGINVQPKGGAWKSLALLHGMHLGASDIATIENLAVVSIVS